MSLFWVVMLVAGALSVDSEISHSKGLLYSAQSGPLCWGPGIWPHPENCRLFTICQLKYEVKGQLFICPENTGFSTKHLKCVAKVLVPNCMRDSPLNMAALEKTTAVRLEPASDDEMDANACNTVATPYCRNDDVLVVCGPNNAYMGVVNCSAVRKNGVRGRCDTESRSCSQYYSPYLSTTTSTPETDDNDAENNMIESKAEDVDLDSDSEESSETSSPSSTTTPDPHLPPSEDLVCRYPGLQCHDNVTIMDCPEDLSEPNFVMSCSNIIVTPDRNASGYCNVENPSCVMLVEGFKMNLEIALFEIDDDDDSSPKKKIVLNDFVDDYSEPELYDSDLFRESTGLFDGLAWFRAAENASRLTQKRAIKTPQIILVPSDQGEVVTRILGKECNQSLYCFDNSTLLTCSGDPDNPTYAVICSGEGVTADGEAMIMHCDTKVHSCVVNFASELTTTLKTTTDEEELTTESTPSSREIEFW